jgi:uncharacterized protein (DUF2345 family)
VIEGARNRLSILRKKMAAAQQAQAQQQQQQQQQQQTQQKRSSITSITGSVPKASSPLSQLGGPTSHPTVGL